MTTANGKGSHKFGDHTSTGHQINREAIGVVTLAAGLTLTLEYRNVQKLDCGGSARTAVLPAESGADGSWFFIQNASDDAAELLTVTDDTPTTLEILGKGEGCYFYCDGSSWYSTGLDAGRVRTIKVTIPAASVKVLNATPYAMIAAPAATKYIEVEKCHWLLDFVAVAYDAAAAGDVLTLDMGSGGTAIVDAVAGDAIGAAAADYNTVVQAVPELIPVVATGIYASIAVGEWWAAAGDSPLVALIHYRILDFTA